MKRKQTLLFGLGLIVITNLFVLGGAWYNRSGDPDSVLHLSAREFNHYSFSGHQRDNSGLSLSLKWRVLPDLRKKDFPVNDPIPYNTGYQWDPPAWLHEAKMRELGFPIEMLKVGQHCVEKRNKQLAREVFLALEMDGPSAKAAHDWTQYVLDKYANADTKDSDRAYQLSALREEIDWGSRLFVIDADLDKAMLRKRHPARNKVAIVRGAIKPDALNGRDVYKGCDALVSGHIYKLYADEINVPFSMRSAIEPATKTKDVKKSKASFVLDLAFGKRLEPWILRAQNVVTHSTALKTQPHDIK